MMATRTPFQSNVMGFEEILSGSEGEIFMTPRNSLNSSNLNFSTKPVIRSTTIITDHPTNPRCVRRDRVTPSKRQSASICDRCGNCEACERRQLRTPVSDKRRTYTPNKPENVKSPIRDLISPDLGARGDDESVKSFQPQFISDSQQKPGRQSKWETVRTITETIIKEKDMLIERQKLKRLQLEQQVRDLECKLREMVIAQSTQSVENCTENRLLEQEEQAYRRLSTSARVLSDNNSLAKVMMEKSQVERQLGEAEHKIAELKCSLLTQKSDLQQQVEYYKKLLNLSQEQEQAQEVKAESIKTEGEHALKELSRLKLYLADLPTKEEHTEAKNKLTQTQSELATSKEHIENLVDERSKLQRDYKRLDDELRESNDQVGQLLNQVSFLQKELSVWEEKEELRETHSEDDIVKLREQQGQLLADYEHVKQCEKTDILVQEYEDRITDLSERLEHSEALIQAAQEECVQKDIEKQQLTLSVNQLTTENEELSSTCQSNVEKVKVAEEVVSAETNKLEQCLVEEIVYCTNSLECVMEMCDNPRGLDLADMLATRPTPVTIASPREYKDVLEQQTNSLKLMNEKIEKLRQFILDKYADDMASSGHIDCSMQ